MFPSQRRWQSPRVLPVIMKRRLLGLHTRMHKLQSEVERDVRGSLTLDALAEEGSRLWHSFSFCLTHTCTRDLTSDEGSDRLKRSGTTKTHLHIFIWETPATVTDLLCCEPQETRGSAPPWLLWHVNISLYYRYKHTDHNTLPRLPSCSFHGFVSCSSWKVELDCWELSVNTTDWYFICTVQPRVRTML